MKKEIIGILIFTLLFSGAVVPVINALTIEKNEINGVSEQLNTPRPTLGPYFYFIYFGSISNKSGGGGAYYTFNCVNVIAFAWYKLIDCRCHHYINGEEIWVPNYYAGILTNHFVFIYFELC